MVCVYVCIKRLNLPPNVILFSLPPVANWGLPLAAFADMKKDPEIISPKMTTGQFIVDSMATRCGCEGPIPLP